MIRIFARRPLVFVALSMCLGVYIMVKCLESGTIGLYLGIMLFFTLLTSASYILRAFNFELNRLSSVLNFLSLNRVIWLFCLILYVVGGLFAFNKINNYSLNFDNVEGYITGTVDSLDEYYSNDIIYLKDVTVKTNNFEYNLKGKTELIFSREDETVLNDVIAGNKITFVGTIVNIAPIVNNELNYYDIKDNIRYSVDYVSNLNIVSDGNIGKDDTVRNKILNSLLNEMPSSIAYLSFSILFGDSSYLSDYTNDAFKISGVAHIVAVSGMNVVIIVSLLLFIMKFMKRHKLLKFLIITLVLVGYCYLCDFTPSVVRATIMALVVLLARFLGKQGDILSSLGLACIIICLIWPLSIFDVGFLLSFASVIGIVFFCGGMTNFLHNKCKLPNFLSSSIAVTVSAQIGIYPIMASYFNSFSLYSIPANIVIVPIFSLAYVLLFATVVITYILPFMSFLLVVPAIVMSFVNWFPTIFVDLPFANLYVFGLGAFSILYYIGIIFMSSFIFVQNKIKIPISVVLIISMITFFIVDLLPRKFTHDNAKVLNTYSSAIILTTADDGKYLVGVGSTYDTNSVVETLQSSRIYELDGILLFNNSVDGYKQRTNVEAINEVCKVNQIYVSDDLSPAFNTMKDINILEIPATDVIEINGGTVYPIYYQDELIVVIFDLKEKDYAFIPNINLNQSYYVKSVLSQDTFIYCYDNKDYEYFGNYTTIS